VNARRVKAPRQVLPINAAVIRQMGEALIKFYATGKPASMNRTFINWDNLGKCLIAVSRGEDARIVFGQVTRRGRQKSRGISESRALAYWYARALAPEDTRGAILAALAQFSNLKAPRDNSIERSAAKFKRVAFEILQGDFIWTDSDGIKHEYPQGIDLAPLKLFLAEHTKSVRK